MNSIMTIDKVKSDEEQFMKEIISSKGSNLPANIEDVLNVFEFTDFKAKAFKMLANKVSNLEQQTELYQSAQRSAQQWSIASLYAQKRMGELTKDISADVNTRFVNRKIKTGTNDGVNEYRLGAEKNKDGSKAGIKTSVWRDAERMAKHPEILDRVVENAKAKDEIPTKTAVLNTIRNETQKEINERAKLKGDKKIINETTTATKDYYDLVKGFESGIRLAIVNAGVGKFSPEGKNFMIKKHDKIRKLLLELEDII